MLILFIKYASVLFDKSNLPTTVSDPSPTGNATGVVHTKHVKASSNELTHTLSSVNFDTRMCFIRSSWSKKSATIVTTEGD